MLDFSFKAMTLASSKPILEPQYPGCRSTVLPFCTSGIFVMAGEKCESLILFLEANLTWF